MRTERATGGGCVRLRRWWLPADPADGPGEHDRLLREITVPRPFDLRRFVLEVARARGRRLVVSSVPTRLPEPRAMWCRRGDTDHVLVGATPSRHHRDHLALHGIGHLLLGHQGVPAVAGAIVEFLGAGTLDRLRAQLTRLTCTDEQEREAELFATRVQLAAAADHRRPGAGSPPRAPRDGYAHHPARVR
ncbi:hypothetical protein GA0074696_4028 [Micromonospora purpureochromogenes]|uniref:IrrE N-terminal-like domain-containing protein n=1 Tax=Micromonospora purpureochromogenes TaxID=47872 RepID=A0A1C4Z4J7_9ACTN|nr:hypothetical protein [Micromonospora purpureochromogenes]SCF27890.1 hypothetical protein GA0074696_4028 [Micromonospora purpureochromogenes]